MPALLVFGIFLITLAISIPIGISMVLGSVAPIFLLDVGGNIPQLLHNTFSGANNTPILAVPLFILGGVIMAEGGISKRLFNFFAYFVGRIPGGVPCAIILTCLFYGAISGSGPATTAAVGSMCIPFMVSLGYERRWSAGLIAVAGGLGVIIPPSIPFVLYSMATGVSTGDLFLGGVLPGILIGLFMMIYAVVYCLRKGEDKEKIRDKMTELKGRGLLRLFLDSFWALLCPVIILGGIYSGLLTATESAAVACVWAFIAGVFIYKEIKIADLIPILMKSAKSAAMILFIIAASTAFSWVFTFSGASAALVQLVVSMNLNKTLFCLVVAIILLIFGTFMEGTAIAVLLVPVLWPIAESMGINVIHFGMILCISNVIGTMTPPVAVNIFSAVQVTRSVRELKIGEISKAEIPFFIGYVAVFFLCVFSETFCTFLIR